MGRTRILDDRNRRALYSALNYCLKTALPGEKKVWQLQVDFATLLAPKATEQEMIKLFFINPNRSLPGIVVVETIPTNRTGDRFSAPELAIFCIIYDLEVLKKVR
jgi:hypothetical protein